MKELNFLAQLLNKATMNGAFNLDDTRAIAQVLDILSEKLARTHRLTQSKYHVPGKIIDWLLT